MPIPSPILTRIRAGRPDFTHLALNNLGLDDSDITMLHEDLSHNLYITSVDLARNSVSTEGARLLASLSSIKNLDLQANYIGDKALGFLLNSNCNSQLEQLNVSDNDLTDAGASMILNKIQEPTCKLKYVDIDGNNRVSKENKTLIAIAMKKNNEMPEPPKEKSAQISGVMSKLGKLLR